MKNENFTLSDDLLASREQRFLNCIFDLLIVHTIIASIGTTVIIIGDITKNYQLSNWIESTTVIEKLFFWFVALFLYYFLTEAYYSRTFAKYFTKTIVVTKDGLRPKSYKILIRTLARFIPLEGLTFLSSNIRGLHDMFSNTYVVKKHEFNKKKELFYFLNCTKNNQFSHQFDGCFCLEELLFIIFKNRVTIVLLGFFS